MKYSPVMRLGRICVCSLRVYGSSGFVCSTSMVRSIAATLVLGTVAAAHAVTVNTSNLAAIAAFQAGATIENFDSGLTGLVITSYTPVAVPAGSQFFSRNINDANVPSFNSGGASFNNPAGNPGTPVGVFNPEGGIAAEVASQTNVIGPIDMGLNQAFGSGFIEVRFVNPVNKFGFQVTHGSLVVFAKDINNSNLAGVDSSVNGTIGNFIGISRGAADIGGLTILSTNPNDSFTFDDFTFARATVTPP